MSSEELSAKVGDDEVEKSSGANESTGLLDEKKTKTVEEMKAQIARQNAELEENKRAMKRAERQERADAFMESGPDAIAATERTAKKELVKNSTLGESQLFDRQNSDRLNSLIQDQATINEGLENQGFDTLKDSHEKREAAKKSAWSYFRCCALSNCCRAFAEVGHIELVKYAQTGDLVLFNNSCNLGTCIISCFTRSDWDHVGMVFRKPGGQPHEVYIVEALNPKVEIAYLQEIVDLIYRTDGEGVMYWRPWRHPNRCSLTTFVEDSSGGYVINESATKEKQNEARKKGGRGCGSNRTEEEIEKIAMAPWNTVYQTKRCDCGWVNKEPNDPNYPNGRISPCLEKLLFKEAVFFKDKPYEKTPSSMVMSAISQDAGFWNGLFGTCCCERCGKERFDAMRERETSQSVFCSELVAHLCLEGDLIDKEVLSQEFLPKDFSNDPNANVKDHYIPWEQRFGDRKKDAEGNFVDPEFVFELVDEFRIVRKLKRGFSADGSDKVTATERASSSDETGGGDESGRNTTL